jgi:ribosome biogenesis GTPase / thiamine phosphate phosphatase
MTLSFAAPFLPRLPFSSRELNTWDIWSFSPKRHRTLSTGSAGNSNCAGEPGCAVSAALKTGDLEPARWASYQKLLAEARYHERSVDQRETAEMKRKWKVIHKAMRHHPKHNR